MLEKIVDLLGIESSKEFLNKKDMRKISSNIANDLTDLASYLPYDFVDQGNDIIVCEGEFMASTYQVRPISGMSNPQIFFDAFKRIIERNIPKDSYLQFTLVAGPKIDSILHNWQNNTDFKSLNNRSQAEIAAKLMKNRADFFRYIAKEGDIDSVWDVKNFTIYVSFVMPCYSYTERNVKDFKRYRKNISNALREVGLDNQRLDAYDILWVTRCLINADNETEDNYTTNDIFQYMYRGNQRFADQIINSNGFDVTSKLVKQVDHDMVSKTFKINSLPDELDLTNIFSFIGSMDSYGNRLPCSFVINYVIKNIDGSTLKEQLRTYANKKIEDSESSDHRNNYQLQREANEARELKVDLDKKNVVEDYWSLTINGKEGNIDVLEERAVSLFRDIGWDIIPNNRLHLINYLTNLPYICAKFWDDLKTLKLVRNADNGEATCKLPIAAETKISSGGGVLLVGRRGQVITLNPFEKTLGNSNFNGIVAASSGSGKSVFLQDLVLNMISQNVDIFIIDIGDSYQNLTELLEGDYIRFDSENTNKLSLDPLFMLYQNGRVSKVDNLEYDQDGDVSDFSYTVNILASMCMEESSKSNFGLLAKLLSDLMTKRKKLSLKNVYDSLLDLNNPESMKMANALYPYLDKGIYGKYFSSDVEPLTFGKNLTVFDLGQFQDQKDFCAVIVQILGNMITQKYIMGDRSKKFMIIVDEGRNVAEVMDSSPQFGTFPRKVRKYGGSMFYCMQSLADFYLNEFTNVLRANSDWQFIMRHSAISQLENIEEYKDLVPVIGSLRSAQKSGKGFSEMIVRVGGSVMILAKLILDPYSLAMYSTDQMDVNWVNEQRKLGRNVAEIIEDLAAKKSKHQNLEGAYAED